MDRMKRVVLMAFIMLVTIVSNIATSPNTINYQGRLTTPGGTAVTNGNYSVVFSLYSVSTGGSAIWSETQTVSTVDGLVSVQMGAVTSFPTYLFDDSLLWLGIKVGTDPELLPRSRLVSVPYAIYAQRGGGWKDGGTRVYPTSIGP
jgi:hypothetical protein